MATATKRSPDYDPVEEALDIGFGVGREHERKARTRHVEQARRGGERRGHAAGAASEREKRERRAQARAETRQVIRKRRAEKREEELASARRGAYRAGQADLRRTLAAQPRAQRRPATPSVSAPSFRPVPVGGGLDRTRASRIIVVLVAASFATIVYREAFGPKQGPTTVKLSGGKTLTVPKNLRSMSAVLMAGTVSLVVGEVNPGLGVLMAGFLLLDTGFTHYIGNFGDRFFGGATSHPAPSRSGGSGGATNIPVRPTAPPHGGVWYPSQQGPGGNPPLEVPYGAPSG